MPGERYDVVLHTTKNVENSTLAMQFFLIQYNLTIIIRKIINN